MNKEDIFKQTIINNSIATNWDNAKTEWMLDHISYLDNNCICGHDIKQNCHIVNVKNNIKLIVGNCCIDKFFSDSIKEQHKIFNCIKRLISDNEKSMNNELLDYVTDKQWLTDWEIKFYQSTKNKRVLSGKQLDIRVRINNKILNKLTKKEVKEVKNVKVLDIQPKIDYKRYWDRYINNNFDKSTFEFNKLNGILINGSINFR